MKKFIRVVLMLIVLTIFLATTPSEPRADGEEYELLLELNYNVQIFKWLHVIPDIQYIINPGGTGDVSDALVLGFQLALNL